MTPTRKSTTKPTRLPLALMYLMLMAVGCATHQPQWHRYELCFGMSRDEGTVIISEQDWQQFQSDEIVRRFPDGYTITQANGYWSIGGSTYSEPSKILMVVAPDPVLTQQKLNAIAEAYAQAFHQDAVLQITSPADVTFHSAGGQ